MPKKQPIQRTDAELRQIILEFFHSRNRHATSAMADKSGAAAKISIVNRALKESHGLKRDEIRRNLTYLISEGWIEEVQVTKSVPLKSGTVIPQATSYYRITAAGIDKIEGPGEFTMPKFHGINIEATGQNIITVGDGNEVDAKFESIGNELAGFKDAVRNSGDLTESNKVSVIADIDSIQAQLAKSEPNRPVLRSIWEGVKALTTGTGLATNVVTLTGLLGPLLA